MFRNQLLLPVNIKCLWKANMGRQLYLYPLVIKIFSIKYVHIKWMKNNLFLRYTIWHYTVIDWVQGQHKFCLTGEQICFPKQQAVGNRSLRGSNKTSQSITVLWYTFIFSKFSYSLFPLTYPLDVFNTCRQVWESGQSLDIVTSISHVLFNQRK